ncbi:MAG: Rne/Rng family ribonuclease [Candidatus Gastranaerophilales bacterium]|nr:Rne/Rng family ribonuclease [Candidatus Gastranaerophilales bacterium]
MSKAIVVAERDNIAAVIEDGKVCEFYVHRGDMLLNDVYLATVDNILPSIDAAFVNVGYDKMGFLHANDAIGKGTLKEKLSPKQKIIVQVVKEPVGHKGPRVSTMISLPGRFLVLMPQETGINVSRKIVNAKERARLKSIISLLKPVGLGVIVRTEAEGQSDADIQEDMEILLEKWNTIVAAAETRPAPSLLYRDQDLLYRVMREACSEDVNEIILDTSYGVHRTQQILQNWNMNKNIEVNAYKGSETLLVASGIVKEIKSALQTKVNLPSGGYLFIQTTEALTVIDVNSGKFVSSTTQDETIVKTNLEAVHEIARQLRLRNIGGMVIVDFIDMNNRRDKLAIMEELEIALDKDKAKPQVGQLSDLGLVELTRHRQGQSLSELFGKKCPHCQGTGYIADDLNFSSPVVEGEIKAKAAKLKIPVQQIKNKTPNYKQNKVFNNPNNNPLNEVNEQQQNNVQNNNPNNGQNNNQNGNNNHNHKKNKFNKFNKNQQNNEQQEQNVVQVEENVEIPQIQEEVIVKPVETVEPIVEVKEASVEEVKETKETKAKKPRKTTTRKKQTPKEEEVKEVVEKVEEQPKEVAIEVEEKPKKKVTRKPRKAKKEEQKVNE